MENRAFARAVAEPVAHGDGMAINVPTVSRTAPFLKRRGMLAASTSAKNLAISLAVAQKRADDAKTIGWPALAQSWQIDVDIITARISELYLANFRRTKQGRAEADAAFMAGCEVAA